MIKANAKNGDNNPVITCKTYKTNEYGHQAIIYDKDNNHSYFYSNNLTFSRKSITISLII